MREIYDIRIMNPSALRKIPSAIGRDLNADFKFLPDGSRDPLYFPIRQILIEKTEPFFGKLVNIVNKYKIFGVTAERVYSDDEIRDAKAFQMIVNRLVDTAGDECGTAYDKSQVCQICGSGIKQVSNLKLHTNKLPKTGGWATTIGDEEIASSEICMLVEEYELSGIEFKPIMRCNSNKAINNWFQPVFTAGVNIDHTNTTFGNHFFIEKESEVYSCGHIAGLNILSELTIHGNIECDFNVTSQKKGSGPMIVVSPRVRKLLIENQVNGVIFEIAHITK